MGVVGLLLSIRPSPNPMQVAKFRSYFYDYQQAIAFKDWVFFEDGYYFAAILLRDNRWICGANIKQDRRLYIDYDCQIDDYCPNGNYSSPQHTPYPPSPPPASYPAPPPPHYKSSDDSEAQSSSHKARHASQRLEEPSAKTLRYPSYEFNSEGQGAEDRGPKDYSPAVSFFPMLLESIGIVETAASQAKERQPGQQKPFCSQYYTVRWELTLLPAVGSTASTRAFGPLGWPPSADGHFYRITDPLIRQLAGEYIGLEQDSERIQLVEIEHSVGGLSGSSCPGGIVKHARYEFLFGSELEARRLQEWLDRGDSSGLVASLRTRDSAGMCSGRGATEPIRREARC